MKSWEEVPPICSTRIDACLWTSLLVSSRFPISCMRLLRQLHYDNSATTTLLTTGKRYVFWQYRRCHPCLQLRSAHPQSNGCVVARLRWLQAFLPAEGIHCELSSGTLQDPESRHGGSRGSPTGIGVSSFARTLANFFFRPSSSERRSTT